MTAFLASAALGWFLRRILDWGGWLGAVLLGIINFYNALPPQLQGVIVKVLEGNWQQITLGALPGSWRCCGARSSPIAPRSGLRW